MLKKNRRFGSGGRPLDPKDYISQKIGEWVTPTSLSRDASASKKLFVKENKKYFGAFDFVQRLNGKFNFKSAPGLIITFHKDQMCFLPYFGMD